MIGEKSKAFAKYATVFRYPYLDEQASYYGYGWDAFNTDLDQETGRSYEVGVNLVPIPNLSLDLTLYRIDMEDEIAPDQNWVNQNLDKTRHEGIELGASYLWEKATRVYAQMSYRRAEFRNGPNAGKDVPLVSNLLGTAGAILYLPGGFELNPEIHYAGEAYRGGDLSNSEDKIDDTTLCNLFLYYRPTLKKLKFSAFAGVENLTDEKPVLIYYNGYYPLPGITVKGGISFKF